MPASRAPAPATLGVCLLALVAGCGDPASVESGDPASEPPLSQSDRALYQKLQNGLSEIINEQTVRYTPLQYNYSEGLLTILDQFEPFVSGEPAGDPPRFMPNLDAEDERDHLRETVRRWKAKTGRNLRDEVDRFKTDVAVRKPGESFHPDFQAKFSQAFDDFVAIEVAELRERRNRAIHDRAETLLAPHREQSPEVVRRLDAILDTPPYDLPASASPSPSPPNSESKVITPPPDSDHPNG